MEQKNRSPDYQNYEMEPQEQIHNENDCIVWKVFSQSGRENHKDAQYLSLSHTARRNIKCLICKCLDMVIMSVKVGTRVWWAEWAEDAYFIPLREREIGHSYRIVQINISMSVSKLLTGIYDHFVRYT